MFPKIGVPPNGRFIMEHLIKMDDLGVPLFSETSIPFPNQHIGKEIFDPKKCVKNLQGEAGRRKVNFLVAGGILHRQKKMGKNPPSSPVRECFTAPTPNFHAYTQKILQIRLKLAATKAFSWKNSRIFCLEFWRDFFGGSKEPLRFSDSTWYCLDEILEETATRWLEQLEPYGKANSWWLCFLCWLMVFVQPQSRVLSLFHREKSTLSMVQNGFHSPNWLAPSSENCPPAATVVWFFFQSRQKRCVSNGVGSKAHTLAMSPFFAGLEERVSNNKNNGTAASNERLAPKLAWFFF